MLRDRVDMMWIDMGGVNHIENNTISGTLCGIDSYEYVKAPEYDQPQDWRTDCWLCAVALTNTVRGSSLTPILTSSSPAPGATA